MNEYILEINYYNNGKIRFKSSYTDNRNKTTTEWYFENGQLDLMCHYLNYQQIGFAKSYYQYGGLHTTEFYL